MSNQVRTSRTEANSWHRLYLEWHFPSAFCLYFSLTTNLQFAAPIKYFACPLKAVTWLNSYKHKHTNSIDYETDCTFTNQIKCISLSKLCYQTTVGSLSEILSTCTIYTLFRYFLSSSDTKHTYSFHPMIIIVHFRYHGRQLPRMTIISSWMLSHMLLGPPHPISWIHYIWGHKSTILSTGCLTTQWCIHSDCI